MTEPHSQVPNIALNDGRVIPQLGFGVYQVTPEETCQAVLEALDVGYRHIDTAQMYGNEVGVGEAIRASGISREEVFVTSKLNNGFHDSAAAHDAFDATLDALGFEYLDLFLIHWPLPRIGDFVETWRALESLQASGRVRSIGVSNFQEHHLRRLLGSTDIVPAVNQIEIHPYLVQDDLRQFNHEHGIVTEAWSPLAQGAVLRDPVLEEIAGRLRRTTAQVTLRWHLQRGDVVFPKSIAAARVAENFAVFDFELTEHDVDRITSLDRHQRTGPNPDTFNWIPGS